MNFEAQRQHIVELCIHLSLRGYFAGTGGNIMLRIDAEHVAVTPSAMDYFAMGPADVCVLRLSNLEKVSGDQTPTVEASLHAQVLRARPDVGCSIHTHQPVASACALLGHELMVPLKFRQTLGTRVPVAGYAPSGSAWLSFKLSRQIAADVNAYLMLNHGILCCGRDSAAALQAVEDLERLASAHLRSRIAERAAVDAALGPALWRVTDALDRISPS